MRLLPYERLTLRSDDPPEVVRARLATLVTTKRFYLKLPPQPFRGLVKGGHFKVVRILGSSLATRDSWQPVVIGDVVPAPGGTEIRGRMRPALPGAVSMALSLGALLWLATDVFFDPRGGGMAWALLGVMLLVGYAGMSVSFWREVRKARGALCEGLGCRVVEQSNRLVR